MENLVEWDYFCRNDPGGIMGSRGRNPHSFPILRDAVREQHQRAQGNWGEIWMILGDNKSMPEWQQNIDFPAAVLLGNELDLPIFPLTDCQRPGSALVHQHSTKTQPAPGISWVFSEFQICFPSETLAQVCLNFCLNSWKWKVEYFWECCQNIKLCCVSCLAPRSR